MSFSITLSGHMEAAEDDVRAFEQEVVNDLKALVDKITNAGHTVTGSFYGHLGSVPLSPSAPEDTTAPVDPNVTPTGTPLAQPETPAVSTSGEQVPTAPETTLVPETNPVTLPNTPPQPEALPTTGPVEPTNAAVSETSTATGTTDASVNPSETGSTVSSESSAVTDGTPLASGDPSAASSADLSTPATDGGVAPSETVEPTQP